MSEMRMEVMQSTMGESVYLNGHLIHGYPASDDKVVKQVYNINAHDLSEIINGKGKDDECD